MWQPLTKNSLMDLVAHGVEVLVVNATNSQLQVCILTEGCYPVHTCILRLFEGSNNNTI